MFLPFPPNAPLINITAKKAVIAPTYSGMSVLSVSAHIRPQTTEFRFLIPSGLAFVRKLNKSSVNTAVPTDIAAMHSALSPKQHTAHASSAVSASIRSRFNVFTLSL